MACCCSGVSKRSHPKMRRTWVQFFCSMWALSFFFVSAAPGEADAALAAVAQEVIVDEFGAVVRIDGQQLKGETLADFLQRIRDAGLALSKDHAGLAPARLDVGQVQRVEEFSRGAGSGVGHQVYLAVAGLLHIPVVRPDGNLLLEQRAGLGVAVDAPFERALPAGEAAVHLPGAHAQQQRLHFRGAGGIRWPAQGSHSGSSALSLTDQG